MITISKSRESWANGLLAVVLLMFSAFHVEGKALTPAMGMQWHYRHPDVAFYEGLYAKQADRIQGLMNRSAATLGLITTQLQRRKLPLELLFIPLIESGYSPHAESPVGAVGPWQLMPQTAQQYGVVRNEWFDGRRDLMASTRAALDYLTYLHSLFEHDWPLALAAYNAGEGTVQAAIQQRASKGLRADLWSLALPDETKQYVPKLMALVRLYRAGKLHLPPVPEASRLVALRVEDGINMAWLARQLGRPLEEVSHYNAGLENAVAPRGSRVAIWMPMSWRARAELVLGDRGKVVALPDAVNAPLLAKRRSLPDEDLHALGWGVGLLQVEPAAADLYPQKAQSKEQGEKALARIAPHWQAKIDPVSQWNGEEAKAKAEAESPELGAAQSQDKIE